MLRYHRRKFGFNSCIIIIALLVEMFLYQPEMFKTGLVIVILSAIAFFIIRHFFLNFIYKTSIRFVNRQFVLRDNTLHNENVTIIYTPDEKIVVMDNFADKRRAKKMFTLHKSKLNVNKAWHRACKVFDSYMTLESLATFYSYDTNVDIITLEVPETPKKKEMKIDRSNQGPKFVEMTDVKSDSFGDGANRVNDKGARFVDMSNIQEQEQYIPKAQTESQYANFAEMQTQDKYVPKDAQEQQFSDLGDILSSGSNKIDVNFATASEIAILPGINIVGAKKIVEHRDLNGLFKTADEFFEVANVKEHFVQKIKPMIVLGKPSTNICDENSEGRIVDF
jgi:DNA uptake protein ComE-like DNA-binding protein